MTFERILLYVIEISQPKSAVLIGEPLNPISIPFALIEPELTTAPVAPVAGEMSTLTIPFSLLLLK